MGKKYGFHYKKGGVLTFDGIQLDGKQIFSAVKSTSAGRTNIIITFADGNIYKFSCIKNGDSLSDIKEYWNDEPIYEEEEE